jgi:monoamine oxidase
MRGISVLIAGAGLAGLTAARDLMKKGADVTVVEARSRLGGRVLTIREPFLHRQHAEAGGDLIDESQEEICKLISELGLKRAKILPGGFTGIRQLASGRRVRGKKGWYELQRKLQPEIRAYCLGEQRWDGGVAQSMARESVAHWLDRIDAPQRLRDTATGFRGFFLADPEDLSLLALVDQFAEDGVPGGDKMFRIVGGNDRLVEALAKPLGDKVKRDTILCKVRHSSDGVSVTVQTRRGLDEMRANYLVCTLPASTLRDVSFDPALPDPQRDAIASVRYGASTKTSLQFEHATWRKRGKPRAYGTNLSIGALWDASEEQHSRSSPSARHAGILTLLAGGSASTSTREMLATGGPERIVDELTWLDVNKTKLLAWDSISWEQDIWARGGYAFFDTQFRPVLREWLARPCGRIFFAGEHTSVRAQGYMNGAVETGLRAAEEVAASERDKGQGARGE